MKTETEYSAQGCIVTEEEPGQSKATVFVTLESMFILCCFHNGPNDWMVSLIPMDPVVGTIEKMEGERCGGIEDHVGSPQATWV